MEFGTIHRLMERDGGACQMCGIAVKPGPTKGRPSRKRRLATVDHITPRSKGG